MYYIYIRYIYVYFGGGTVIYVAIAGECDDGYLINESLRIAFLRQYI